LAEWPLGRGKKEGATVHSIKPIVCGLGLLSLTACFEAEKRFDDFVDKKKELAGDAGPGGDDGGPIDNTEPLTAEQIAGSYLYAVSTPIAPTRPVVYVAELEAAPTSGIKLEVRIRQQPLSITDRKTPVGDFSAWTTMEVLPTGVYESPPITTVVPAGANSFGIPLTTTITFRGTFVNPATPEMPDAKVEFFCGTVPMGVVEGLNLPLDGSTFAATRIPDPSDTSTYPDTVINCSKDPAAPL
jgi:hypothetical protein